MPIQNKIKEMRLKKDVTQEDLATAVNVSRQTIVAIEKGNYTPSLMLAIDLAKFFKVKIEDIFYEK
jgi:putative transcriptional regulator